jgi:CRISPR/Cas system CMR-associated protein Cmr5 small subunit
MKKAIEIINGILEEELDVIAEGKRNTVAKRIVKELNLDGIQFFSIGKEALGKSHSFNPALYKTDNIECSSENDNFNKDEYLKHLSEDVFTVKIRERSTGRIIELNPNIDNSFSDTMTRNLFHSGEYILISGNLPDKWK